MLQSENKGSKLAKHKKYMLVRYGHMGLMGWFEHSESHLPRVHTKVIVKTERGLELGDVVGPYCYKAGQFRLNDEQVEKYYQDSGAEQVIEPGGVFERFATPQDLHEDEKLNESAQEELECCRRFVKEMNLQMKVVGAEHIFGGERIIFYFIADGRVDFRELVKRLAKEYQTRIEMRQIGSRDEARLAGDYETCGLECCCKRFLKILKPVNMRMAKLQKATLDPSKISGHCGRLKCCLRYEDDTYRELRDRLPKKNTRVRTAHGEGRVVDTQVLTQLVKIQSDDGSEYAVPVEEITIIGEPPVDSRREEKEEKEIDADIENFDEIITEENRQQSDIGQTDLTDETDLPDETDKP
jgi:cell fate regulator YaaT (PSP1 superfamily)